MAILDNDGKRILAKYYDGAVLSTTKEQKAFEKSLFGKTHRANAEIITLDGLTCVYRSNVDLFFYVMGSSQENPVRRDEGGGSLGRYVPRPLTRAFLLVCS